MITAITTNASFEGDSLNLFCLQVKKQACSKTKIKKIFKYFMMKRRLEEEEDKSSRFKEAAIGTDFIVASVKSTSNGKQLIYSPELACGEIMDDEDAF